VIKSLDAPRRLSALAIRRIADAHFSEEPPPLSALHLVVEDLQEKDFSTV
jgi:hypothetical protein